MKKSLYCISLFIGYIFSTAPVTLANNTASYNDEAVIITVPDAPQVICENGDDVDITTLVSATPTGGSFVFSGIGVTGSTFSPTGLSGLITITVDYTLGVDTDQASFDFLVLDASDDACGQVFGDCATVQILPIPSPATCNNLDGSVEFDIDPPIPAVNNTGITIDIESEDGAIMFTNINVFIFSPNNGKGLPFGTYNYSVEYGDPSCIKTGTFIVDKTGTVGVPEISNITDATCFGEATGSATISVPSQDGKTLQWSLDGTIWNNFVAGSTVSGIPPGVAPDFEQTIFIREENVSLCNESVTFVLQNQFEEIEATLLPLSNASCSNNDGSIQITNVTGGNQSAPYSFQLNGKSVAPDATGVLEGLSGGTHILSVIDGQGCTKEITFSISSPGLVTFNLTDTPPSCFGNGNDGKVQAVIDSDFLPGDYEIAITENIENELVFFPVPDDGFYEFTALTTGRYFVYVKSSDNCTTIASVNIEGPNALDFDLEVICTMDNIKTIQLSSITGEEATPITIEVYENGAGAALETFEIAFPENREYRIENKPYLSTPGEYLIKLVQLQQACPSDLFESASQEFTILSPVSAEAITITPSIGEEPSATFIVTNFSGGSEPYQIKATLDSAAISGQSFDSEWETVTTNPQNLLLEKQYENVPAGRYNIQITDQNGCTISLVHRVERCNSLNTPSNLMLTAQGAAVTLTWEDNNTEETGFTIEKQTETDGLFREVVKTAANVVEYVDDSENPSKEVVYRVAAFNECTQSEYTSAIVVISGLNNKYLSESVAVYPNPSHGNYTISLPPQFGKNIVFEILDTKGKLLMVLKNPNIQDNRVNFDLEGLSEGSYILKVTYSKGALTRNIIKTH